MAVLNHTGLIAKLAGLLLELDQVVYQTIRLDIDIAGDVAVIATKLDDVRIALECAAVGDLTASAGDRMQRLFSDCTPILALPALETSGWRGLEAS
jgi:hypothetical protein